MKLWVMIFNDTEQYFSYIVVVSVIGGGNRSTQRKPSTCLKLPTNSSHNVVSSTARLSGIWAHNISGDRHQLQIQLPYDHGPLHEIKRGR